jgi:hypothetical protein
MELGQWTGIEVPEQPEELSDDEPDELEIKKLSKAGIEGAVKLFADDDTRLFYEKLGEFITESIKTKPISVSVDQAAMTATRSSSPAAASDEVEDETANFAVNEIEHAIDNINLSDLESSDEEDPDFEEEIQLQEEPANVIQEEKANGEFCNLISNIFVCSLANREISALDPLDNVIGISLNISMFLAKLSNAINKERIDAAALEFIGHFNTKGNRKRLIQHLLAAPYDRLDLLPFYCR